MYVQDLIIALQACNPKSLVVVVLDAGDDDAERAIRVSSVGESFNKEYTIINLDD